MMGKTHMVGGLLAGTIAVMLIPEISQGEQVVVLAASTIGGLLPDIDHPNSKASKTFPFLAVPFWILSKIAKLINPKGHLMGHRGLTHYLDPWIALFALGLYLNMGGNALGFAICAGLAIGAASHIALDMLNPSGVPLLFALQLFRSSKQRKSHRSLRVSICKISTGSGAEKAFAVLLVVVTGFMVYRFIGNTTLNIEDMFKNATSTIPPILE